MPNPSSQHTQRPVAHRGSGLPAMVGALAAVLLAVVCGCRPTANATPRGGSLAVKASATGVETSPSLGRVDQANYRAISERDLFRPLVAAPKSSEGGGGAAERKSGASGAATGKGGSGAPRGSAQGGPPRPPDPTADLALTGIIETTDGLRALVEQISMRKGEFVALGETAFGFVVKSITADTVTLAQGPRTYELKLGAKEIPAVEPAVASTPSPTPSRGVSSASSGPPSSMPNFGGMSSDQRRQAFQNWWNGMSEEQRQQFRSRRGGGGFGGPGGGFGGGRGSFGRDRGRGD